MHNREHKGFSLVELVVYIAILTAILAVIISVIITLSRTEASIRTNVALSDSATSVLERFVREARSAKSVSVSNSIFNTNPGVLELVDPNTGGTARTVDFSVSGGGVHLKENGVDQGALTSGSVNVTNMTFTLTSTSTLALVRIQLSLESGTTTSYRHEDFYTAATLRNDQ